MSANTKDVKFYIHVAMTLLIMFGFGLLPPFGQVTPLGMKLLGIFIGLVYAWTFTSMIWSSLLAFVAIVWSGAYTIGEFMAVSMGNTTVCFMLFSMILVASLTQVGLVDYFGKWFISREFLAGRPWLFTWVFLFACFLLGALTNGTAATLIFLSMFFSIAKQVGIKPYSKYATLMVFGIIFAGMTLGNSALPYHLAGLLKITTIQAAVGYTVSFSKFTIFAFPSGLLVLTMFVIFLKYVLRADVSALADRENISMKDVEFTKAMQVGTLYLILFVLLLFLPEWIPSETWIGAKMSAYGSVGAACLILAAMLVTKVDGKPFLNFKQAANEGIVWDIIILFAVVLPFSSLLVADATGIKATFVAFLKPVLTGHSPVVFLLIALALQTFVTNFMNNAVLGVIFTNVVGPIAVALGMNPLPVLMTSMFTNQLAYLTPAASTPAAFMFGHSDWARAQDLVKVMPLIIIFLFIICFCVVLPWGYVVFSNFAV